MNKSSLIGFIAVGVIFYFAIFLNAKVPLVFLEWHTLLIVWGGTVAAALIAYPYATLSRTIDYFIWGLLFKKQKDYLKISQDIAGARNSFLINQNYMTNDDCHPFLREAVLFLLNRNIDNEAFKQILQNRSDFFKKKYVDDAQVLKSLIKYPIALGFLGATVKIVGVLLSFETSTQAAMATELSVAFVSIFWGVAFACFVLFPLADSANKAVNEDQVIRNLIIDGMILIREKATDDYFQAYLRGYLSLSDRGEFKILGGKMTFPYGSPVPKVEKKHKEVAHEKEPYSVPDASEVKANSKMELSGRVDEPVKIETNASTDLGAFKFKDLRRELQHKRKKSV
jgi:chemotaxis protein MotA